MTLLQEAEKLLAAMSHAEKAQLLQWVVQDLGDAFPGIESVPGVCGDDPCIVRTAQRYTACEFLASIYAWFTEGFDTADLQEAKALLEALT